jgi:hypothetical protein
MKPTNRPIDRLFITILMLAVIIAPVWFIFTHLKSVAG